MAQKRSSERPAHAPTMPKRRLRMVHDRSRDEEPPRKADALLLH